MINSLADRIRGLASLFWREVAKFGAVGGVAFVIDSAVFIWLFTGPMHGSEVWAKALATIVASIFSWIANRYWTFRHRKQANVLREALLFAVMNIVGLLIASGCVWFAKYILNLNDRPSLFIAGSVVGLVLGTIFRFFAYRFWVFNNELDQEPEFSHDHELIELHHGGGAGRGAGAGHNPGADVAEGLPASETRPVKGPEQA
ncbi:GtrA family protein [Pseudarthrobacter sp. J75]|uniref:GtrA family protein n=1 Tax=unclassified Pseudarthrobacter TaxID=2647000 RepID=UPI002E815977|nr:MULTISPECIES: GtrA family protein [unclassified Pseudarthrobacter]MEE2521631.1 GtrA family protein [Pseudarthrobacter sp. J47]MEE2527708.1 GtrA family protein [Pseudarthrobacter sp. J75]